MKLRLLFNTVRHLKPIQVRYRLKYFFKNRFDKKSSLETAGKVSSDRLPNLKFQQSIYNIKSYSSEGTFTFLNLSHSFPNEIDWNLPDYGRLWTYNLNYFDAAFIQYGKNFSINFSI